MTIFFIEERKANNSAADFLQLLFQLLIYIFQQSGGSPSEAVLQNDTLTHSFTLT